MCDVLVYTKDMKLVCIFTTVALVTQALILFLFGQPVLCECGYIKIWAGDIFSSDNSQHLFDWYTFSHILHGIIFYGILSLLFPKKSVSYKLFIALALEVSWELLENTPMVIDHYRQTALAQGYTGDSIINSISDTIAMIGGFVLAQKNKIWVTVAIVLVFEIATAYIVRDNLTLNIINLTAPSETIQDWQMNK